MHSPKATIKQISTDAFSDVITDTTWDAVDDYIDKRFIIYKKANEETYYVYYNLHRFEINSIELLLKFVSVPEETLQQNGVKTETEEPKETLYGSNTYNKAFPKHTFELIAALCNELNIPYFKMNDESIRLFEAKLSERENRSSFRRKWLINIIAFVGEAIKYRNPHIKWKMTLSSFDGQTWNPSLVKGKNEFDLLHYVWDHLQEGNKNLVSSLLLLSKMLLP